MWNLRAGPPEGIVDSALWKESHDDFFVATKFLPPHVVDKIIEYAQSTGKISAARLAGSAEGELNEIRRSMTMWMDDYQNSFVKEIYQEFTDAVININNKVFEYNLTGIETLQYTEYHHDVKGTYGWHQDDDLRPGHSNSIRKLSFSIVLSDSNEHEGGEFQVKLNGDVNASIPLNKGDAVFFPSCILHQVTPVTKGTRRSLVGWVRGPNWK